MDTQVNAVAAIERYLKENVPAEIIGGTNLDEAAEMVMLEIAYSPVIPCPFREEDLHIAHRTPEVWEVTPTQGGEQYIVGDRYVTPTELQRMRARYLLWRGCLMELIVKDRLIPRVRDEVVQKFFDGELFVPQFLIDMIKSDEATP